MTTVLGVIAFIAIVLMVHHLRSAANDVAARAIDGAIHKARSGRPATWAIVPGKAAASALHSALVSSPTPGLGGTTFVVGRDKGQDVLRCSTPASVNLQAVQTEALMTARRFDDTCHLRP